MEHTITEEDFKKFSKNLKNQLKEFGLELSLGASYNLLARTFGAKDYNTICTTFKQQYISIVSNYDSKNEHKFINITKESFLNEVNETFYYLYENSNMHGKLEDTVTDKSGKYQKILNDLSSELLNTAIYSYRYIAYLKKVSIPDKLPNMKITPDILDNIDSSIPVLRINPFEELSLLIDRTKDLTNCLVNYDLSLFADYIDSWIEDEELECTNENMQDFKKLYKDLFEEIYTYSFRI